MCTTRECLIRKDEKIKHILCLLDTEGGQSSFDETAETATKNDRNNPCCVLQKRAPAEEIIHTESYTPHAGTHD